MKKITSLIIFVFMCGFIFAQPVFNRNNIFPVNSVLKLGTYTDESFSAIDTTLQGENVMWDFSNLQDDYPADDVSVTIIDNPALTPYYSTFPNANYIEVERYLVDGVTEEGLVYNYYLLSETKKEKLGRRSVYTGTQSTYTNPRTELVFPLTYNTVSNDVFETEDGESQYNFKCVGYGTLKLPGNNIYDNVLMIRQVSADIFQLNNYAWYDADNGATLVACADFLFYSQIVFSKDIILDAQEVKSLSSFIKYNNPVDDKLNISIDNNDISNVSYVLVNTIGNIVLNGQSSDVSSFSIDMSSLSAGMYILTLNSDNSAYNPEIIKVLKK